LCAISNFGTFAFFDLVLILRVRPNHRVIRQPVYGTVRQRQVSLAWPMLHVDSYVGSILGLVDQCGNAKTTTSNHMLGVSPYAQSLRARFSVSEFESLAFWSHPKVRPLHLQQAWIDTYIAPPLYIAGTSYHYGFSIVLFFLLNSELIVSPNLSTPLQR
jgi:hypothetical protein